MTDGAQGPDAGGGTSPPRSRGEPRPGDGAKADAAQGEDSSSGCSSGVQEDPPEVTAGAVPAAGMLQEERSGGGGHGASRGTAGGSRSASGSGGSDITVDLCCGSSPPPPQQQLDQPPTLQLAVPTLAPLAAQQAGAGALVPARTGQFCLHMPPQQRQQLSDALVHDSLRMFPVSPERISNVRGPVVKVQKVDDHTVDVQLMEGFRASFTEPLRDVGARAAAAYTAASVGAPAQGPMLATCPACSCTVEEHAGGAAVGRDGAAIPATDRCWVVEPPERPGTAGSAGLPNGGALCSGPSSGSSGGPVVASVATVGSGYLEPGHGGGAGAAAAAGGSAAAPVVVEVLSDCGQEQPSTCDAPAAGSSPDVERKQPAADRKSPGRQAGGDGGGGGGGGEGMQPHARRSRHHPELTVQHLEEDQRWQRAQWREQGLRVDEGASDDNCSGRGEEDEEEGEEEGADERRGDGIGRRRRPPRRRDARGALAQLNPLDAAVVASPAGLTALSVARGPQRPPRCEWELDPRKVLVGRRLAVGGFAEVFIGKYEGTVIAVKRLLAHDPSTIERFVGEVVMLARIRHPNLILFIGFCTTPELCIVQEYMGRGSLYSIINAARGPEAPRSARARRAPGADDADARPGAPLDPKLQRSVAVGVARGMAYLHTRAPPILHLDLKSPNILIDDRWRVKIADFGLSRVRHRTFLSSSAQGGTPEWMAPEVLRCEAVTEAADVYSYGVVLWEVLTGLAPWENYSPMQVVGLVGYQQASLPRPAAGDPFLIELSMRCMDHSPAKRPTMPEVVAALDEQYGPPSWAQSAQPLLPPTGARVPALAGPAVLALPAPASPRASGGAARAVEWSGVAKAEQGKVPGAEKQPQQPQEPEVRQKQEEEEEGKEEEGGKQQPHEEVLRPKQQPEASPFAGFLQPWSSDSMPAAAAEAAAPASSSAASSEAAEERGRPVGGVQAHSAVSSTLETVPEQLSEPPSSTPAVPAAALGPPTASEGLVELPTLAAAVAVPMPAAATPSATSPAAETAAPRQGAPALRSPDALKSPRSGRHVAFKLPEAVTPLAPGGRGDAALAPAALAVQQQQQQPPAPAAAGAAPGRAARGPAAGAAAPLPPAALEPLLSFGGSSRTASLPNVGELWPAGLRGMGTGQSSDDLSISGLAPTAAQVPLAGCAAAPHATAPACLIRGVQAAAEAAAGPGGPAAAAVTGLAPASTGAAGTAVVGAAAAAAGAGPSPPAPKRKPLAEALHDAATQAALGAGPAAVPGRLPSPRSVPSPFDSSSSDSMYRAPSPITAAPAYLVAAAAAMVGEAAREASAAAAAAAAPVSPAGARGAAAVLTRLLSASDPFVTPSHPQQASDAVAAAAGQSERAAAAAAAGASAAAAAAAAAASTDAARSRLLQAASEPPDRPHSACAIALAAHGAPSFSGAQTYYRRGRFNVMVQSGELKPQLSANQSLPNLRAAEGRGTPTPTAAAAAGVASPASAADTPGARALAASSSVGSRLRRQAGPEEGPGHDGLAGAASAPPSQPSLLLASDRRLSYNLWAADAQPQMQRQPRSLPMEELWQAFSDAWEEREGRGGGAATASASAAGSGAVTPPPPASAGMSPAGPRGGSPAGPVRSATPPQPFAVAPAAPPAPGPQQPQLQLQPSPLAPSLPELYQRELGALLTEMLAAGHGPQVEAFLAGQQAALHAALAPPSPAPPTGLHHPSPAAAPLGGGGAVAIGVPAGATPVVLHSPGDWQLWQPDFSAVAGPPAAPGAAMVAPATAAAAAAHSPLLAASPGALGTTPGAHAHSLAAAVVSAAAVAEHPDLPRVRTSASADGLASAGTATAAAPLLAPADGSGSARPGSAKPPLGHHHHHPHHPHHPHHLPPARRATVSCDGTSSILSPRSSCATVTPATTPPSAAAASAAGHDYRRGRFTVHEEAAPPAPSAAASAAPSRRTSEDGGGGGAVAPRGGGSACPRARGTSSILSSREPSYIDMHSASGGRPPPASGGARARAAGGAGGAAGNGGDRHGAAAPGGAAACAAAAAAGAEGPATQIGRFTVRLSESSGGVSRRSGRLSVPSSQPGSRAPSRAPSRPGSQPGSPHTSTAAAGAFEAGRPQAKAPGPTEPHLSQRAAAPASGPPSSRAGPGASAPASAGTAPPSGAFKQVGRFMVHESGQGAPDSARASSLATQGAAAAAAAPPAASAPAAAPAARPDGAAPAAAPSPARTPPPPASPGLLAAAAAKVLAAGTPGVGAAGAGRYPGGGRAAGPMGSPQGGPRSFPLESTDSFDAVSPAPQSPAAAPATARGAAAVAAAQAAAGSPLQQAAPAASAAAAAAAGVPQPEKGCRGAATTAAAARSSPAPAATNGGDSGGFSDQGGPAAPPDPLVAASKVLTAGAQASQQQLQQP